MNVRSILNTNLDKFSLSVFSMASRVQQSIHRCPSYTLLATFLDTQRQFSRGGKIIILTFNINSELLIVNIKSSFDSS